MRYAACALIAGLLAALPAAAQTPMDATDPAVTKRPTLGDKSGTPPEFPREAMRKRQEGEVKVRTCVDLSGKPHSTEIVQSSGHELLDQASLDWLNNGAVFEPAEANGAPVAVCNYTFTYVWSLKHLPPKASDAYPWITDLPEANRPVMIRKPPPLPYPPTALAAGAEGAVKAVFCVASDGRVIDVGLIGDNALGLNMDLVFATMVWLSAARYTPAKQDGKAIGVCGVEYTYEWWLPSRQRSGQAL